MSFWKWSRTASSNTTADDTVNAREGQAPSTVNDAIRGMMAALAKYRDDMSGNTVTGGGSAAYTVTTYQGLTALADGRCVAFTPHVTNGAAATLNADGTGAKKLRSKTGTDLVPGQLVAGMPATATYNLSADEWRLHGGGQAAFEAGTAMLFAQSAAPVGWTVSTTHDNKALRLTSSGGGSAGGSTPFTTIFAARTIAQANLPNIILTAQPNGAHTHTALGGGALSVPGLSGGGIAGGGDNNTDFVATTSNDGTHGHDVPLGGSGAALDFAVQYVDVMICTKA